MGSWCGNARPSGNADRTDRWARLLPLALAGVGCMWLDKLQEALELDWPCWNRPHANGKPQRGLGGTARSLFTGLGCISQPLHRPYHGQDALAVQIGLTLKNSWAAENTFLQPPCNSSCMGLDLLGLRKAGISLAQDNTQGPSSAAFHHFWHNRLRSKIC